MIDLTDQEQAQLSAILRAYLPASTQVYLFGSRADGSAKPWSDIDLIVKDETPLPLSTFYQLMDAFEESELSLRVDLLDWHRTQPAFLDRLNGKLQPFAYRD